MVSCEPFERAFLFKRFRVKLHSISKKIIVRALEDQISVSFFYKKTLIIKKITLRNLD